MYALRSASSGSINGKACLLRFSNIYHATCFLYHAPADYHIQKNKYCNLNIGSAFGNLPDLNLSDTSDYYGNPLYRNRTWPDRCILLVFFIDCNRDALKKQFSSCYINIQHRIHAIILFHFFWSTIFSFEFTYLDGCHSFRSCNLLHSVPIN